MDMDLKNCFRIVFFAIILSAMMWSGFTGIEVSQAGSDKKAEPTGEKTEKRWIGMNGSWGRSHHIWSDREYYGYRNSQFGIFYEREIDPLFSLGLNIEHTFRAEFRYATLWGRIPLSDDQVSDEEAERTDEHYMTLDHKQVVFLGIRRWVFLPDSFIRPNLHLGFGISVTDELIIEGGTLYAFSFTGGGGIDMDVSDRWTIFSEVSWEHFSNGGQMFMTNKRVIGPESINTRFGVRYRF
jgi:opacity protein-like surface antigen